MWLAQAEIRSMPSTSDPHPVVRHAVNGRQAGDAAIAVKAYARNVAE